MTPDEQREQAEGARKTTIIESKIELRKDGAGIHLSTRRKAMLKEMTVSELQQLVQELQGDQTIQSTANTVYAAIAASEKARRDTDDKPHRGSDRADAAM